MKEITKGDRRTRVFGISIAGMLAVVVAFGATAAGAPAKPQATVTITVNTLPIANALPMDLGIKKGFFAEQGIEITKRTLQSGNDIVLALQNSSGEIGYIGWVPAMIARTQGIPVTAIAASEVEERRRRTTGRTSSSRVRARFGPPPTWRARRSP